MPSALPTFKAAVEAALVAVVPADAGVDPLLLYSVIDTFDEERRNGGHRELMWGRPRMLGLQARGARLIEWSLSLTLFLHRRDRVDTVFGDALANETVDLHRAFWAQSQVGFGSPSIRQAVLDEVELDDPTSPVRRRAGGVRQTSIVARATFPFRVLIQEINP